MRKLEADLKVLASKWKDFPYVIKVGARYGKGSFLVNWQIHDSNTIDDHQSPNVAASLLCEIGFVHETTLFLRVIPYKTCQHKGEFVKQSVFVDGYDWYKQDWRQSPVLVEASAEALWPFLETNASEERLLWSREKLVKEILDA